MNIVRLTTRIYPDTGGTAVYADNLSKNLSGENFRFFNISCQPIQVHRKSEKINPNFIIHYLPIRVPSENNGILKNSIFSIKFTLLSIKKIFYLHRKYRIDLIHIDNPAVTGLSAILLKKLIKIPFIYTQHGLDSPYKLDFLIELRLIYKYTSKYIIISRRMKRFFERNIGNTEKLVWIPNGIELNKFFHSKNQNEKQHIIKTLKLSSVVSAEDFIIIYVGYMVFKQKVQGMIDFIHGFKSFIQNEKTFSNDRIKLLFLGDGKYKKLLQNEITTLKLENNVHVLGSKLGIDKYYAISDLCALTSYQEGFPTVLLEAIASDVPCIATDVGEVSEIIVEEALVPVGRPDIITSRIKKFFEEKSFRDDILRQSKQKIKNFEWRIIAKKIKQLYLHSKYKE